MSAPRERRHRQAGRGEKRLLALTVLRDVQHAPCGGRAPIGRRCDRVRRTFSNSKVTTRTWRAKARTASRSS